MPQFSPRCVGLEVQRLCVFQSFFHYVCRLRVILALAWNNPGVSGITLIPLCQRISTETDTRTLPVGLMDGSTGRTVEENAYNFPVAPRNESENSIFR